MCTENRSFGYTRILFQSGSSKKVAIQRVCVCVYVCICVCKITVEAKYMGLHLLTLLITGEGFSHAQSSSCWRSGCRARPLPYALAVCSGSSPNSARCSPYDRVPFGTST